MSEKVIINDLHGLRPLETAARNAGLGQIPQIVLEFEELSNNDNEHFSNQLNVLRNACGCASGQLFLLTAMVGLAIECVLLGKSWRYIFWTDGLVATVVLFLAAGLGKLFGLYSARLRFIKLLHVVHSKVAQAVAIQNSNSMLRIFGEAKWGEHGTNLQ